VTKRGTPRAGHTKRKALKRRRPGAPRGVASLNGNAESLLSELDALRGTVASLQPFPADAQARVLVSACRFLGVDPKALAV